MKKFLKIILIFLLIIIVAVFEVSYIFKDKIIAIVKTEINKNVNARVNFTDADVSLIRDFPKFSLSLDSFTITGINEFDGDTLLFVKEIDGALNLMSVIKGKEIKVSSIELRSPIVHAIVNKDGKANWDIAKPSTDTAVADTAHPFKMQLKHYAIENGYITYDDEEGNMHAVIRDLDHSGSGDFTADNFILKTTTTAEAVDFSYGGVPYFTKTKAGIDADIQVDNTSDKYQFNTNKILLNGLPLSAAGYFQLLNDSGYGMDITFKSPSTEFKKILSLIPVIYKHDFDDLEASGAVNFDGFVKGVYSDRKMPSYGVTLAVKNGSFKYPDLPGAVKNIQLDASVKNPDGVTDHTVINVTKGHVEMNNAPFDFHLLVNNPVSDMNIDGALKGSLDLSQVAQFVKLEKGTQLSGLLKADVAVKGAVSALEKEQYSRFNAAGDIAVSDLHYVSADMPSGMDVNSLHMTFNPKNVTVSDFKGKYLETNFTASGALDNLLLYIFQDQPLSGTLSVNADRINLNDWMGMDTTAEADEATPAEPFAVPRNIDFTLNAKAGEVIYDKLDLKDVSGAVVMKDQTVYLDNIQANALDGTMAVNGSYSTKESKEKPDISLSYDVKNLDVQKTFLAFNTVRKLMPVAQFIAGKLSSKLQVSGKLGDNMMPVLSTLTGEGNLLLIEGFLKKFEPVDKLASTLNVGALKNISLKDVKTYFSFENGRVNIKPFTINVDSINMQIAGSHGFDQSLDYGIRMAIPRSLIGSKGNALVDNLVAQANDKGIPVKLSDKINLNVLVGGTIKKPVIKTDLKEVADNAADNIKSQVSDFAQGKIDSAKQTFRDSLNKAKGQAVNSLKEQAKQLLRPKDSTAGSENSDIKETGKKVEKTLKNTLNSLFNKKKDTGDSGK